MTARAHRARAVTPRVIVITGASSGIGAATAELLSRTTPHQLVLVARRQAALDAVAARSDGRAWPCVADMSRRDEVRAVTQQTVQRFGRIDVWINNAGRGITRAPSELTDDDIADMMRANVLTALYGMQEVLPHFKARGDGHIINISSLLGRVPAATDRSAYTAAKHFLNALTAMMRDEVRETHPGIQFSIVSPGLVATDFGRNALHGGPDSRSLPQPQDVHEVAAVIARVIETRQPDVYTRRGMQERIARYYATVGVDPE
jgi:NADP-dependent 3-hydroxy acid dehydrogenase YdfG